jgi:hypothetical protein
MLDLLFGQDGCEVFHLADLANFDFGVDAGVAVGGTQATNGSRRTKRAAGASARDGKSLGVQHRLEQQHAQHGEDDVVADQHLDP